MIVDLGAMWVQKLNSDLFQEDTSQARTCCVSLGTNKHHFVDSWLKGLLFGILNVRQEQDISHLKLKPSYPLISSLDPRRGARTVPQVTLCMKR